MNKTVFMEKLYFDIRKTIERMREEKKFDSYPYPSFPSMLRGSETNTKYLNSFKTDNYELRGRKHYTYQFFFHVFFVNNYDVEIDGDYVIKFFLKVQYIPEREELKICIHREGSVIGEYDWKSLFDMNWTMEDILQDFEYSFLGVPPIEILRFSFGLHTRSIESDKYKIMYLHLKYFYDGQKKLQENSLALGMFDHRRLADNSIAKVLSPELVHQIFQEYRLMVPKYPNFARLG